MNIVMVVTATHQCRQFYKLQYQLQKKHDLKILFTDNAQKMMQSDLFWYFQNQLAYKSGFSKLRDPQGNYSTIVGKGKQYYCYNQRLKKFSCCFDATQDIHGGFQHQLYLYNKTGKIQHIELSNWADRAIIYPCTINTYNKMNQGIADNFVLSFLNAFLGTSKLLYCFFDKLYMQNYNFHKTTVSKQTNEYTNNIHKQFVDLNDFNQIIERIK